MIEIIATECGIAPRGQHFEHALGQAQDGNIEGATAQVVHGINAFGAVIQTIGNRRCRRFVEQAQHVEARQTGRILGGLALCIVEIGRHGNHRPHQFAAQRCFRTMLQGFQDFCRNLDRALDAGHCLQAHHAGRLDKIVGQGFHMRDIGLAPPHEALDGNDGVFRIFRLPLAHVVADLDPPIRVITHRRGQQRAAVFIVQAHRHAAPHRRHERVGRPEIDTDRPFVLVRRR